MTTKKELFDYIEHNQGVLFCNEDDPVLSEVLHQKIKCIFYGENKGDITGSILDSDPYISISWQKNNINSHIVSTKLIGNYNLQNILNYEYLHLKSNQHNLNSSQ